MISVISGSVIPARVCSSMFASTSYSSPKARCQATAPAPPVVSNVPSMSQSTALISTAIGRNLPLMLVFEHVALGEEVQQEQSGQDEDDGDAEDDEDGAQGGVGGGGFTDRHRGRQQVGEHRREGAPDHGD